MAILGRWLTPSDFGLMAMVTTVTGFANVFVDAGFSAAVVFRQDSSSDVLTSVFWANTGVGGLLAALVVLGAPLAASFYDEPGVNGLMKLASLVLLASAFGQLPQALLQRALAFNVIARVEVVSAVCGVCAAVGTAALGQGARSFVWGQLAGAALRSAGLAVACRAMWKPSLHFRAAELHGYIGFGAYQLGERTLNYWAANVDYILVGRYVGAQALGVYTVAYQLAVAPLLRLNPMLTRVAFPVLTKAHDDVARLLRGYLELVKAVSFLAFPVLGALAICAPEGLRVLVGPEWGAAVPMVQVMCVMGALKAVGNTTGSLLLAQGRADVGFWWNLLTAVVTTLALLAAVRSGVMTVAIAQSILSCAYFLVLIPILHRSRIGPRLGAVLGAMSIPALCAAAMGAVIVPVLLSSRTAGSSPLVTLVLCVCVGVATYLLAWRVTQRGYLSTLWADLTGAGARKA